MEHVFTPRLYAPHLHSRLFVNGINTANFIYFTALSLLQSWKNPETRARLPTYVTHQLSNIYPTTRAFWETHFRYVPNLPFKYFETQKYSREPLWLRKYARLVLRAKLSRQEGKLLLRNSVRVIAETQFPGDPSALPSLSPTFLQFNVCKRILFQSLVPSRMVLRESPAAPHGHLPNFSPSVCHNMLFDLLKCEYNVGTS